MKNNKPSKKELLELRIAERSSKYSYITKRSDNIIKKTEPVNFETIFDDKKIQEIIIEKEFKPITKLTRDERRCNTLDIVKKDEIVSKSYKPISILITAYNVYDYIEDCLDSVVNQTYFKDNDNYEILLGIDSCKKTLDKVLSISHRYKNLRIFMMNNNKGTYVTTNTLLDLAKYDNILRFDSDDIMCNNLVETVLKYNNEFDIIRFLYFTFEDNIENTYIKNVRYPHGVALFNKKVFDSCGGYQNWICAADTELLKRTSNFFKIKLLNDRLFNRRIHDDSLTQSNNTGGNSDIRLGYEKLIREYCVDENIFIKKTVNKYIEYKNDFLINFENSFYRKKYVDYDAIIIISSYNRYDSLINILNQLDNEKTKYSVKIIVLNDGSTSDYDLINYDNITVLNNEFNYGKKLYWKSINKLFNEASKYSSHCVIQIDDDFILTNNFITKSLNKFFYVKNISNKNVAIRYHTSTNDKKNENRWGFGNNWIDGGGIYDSNFLNLINNKIDEIPLKRWDINPMISSGVWWKLSKFINDNDLSIFETTKSFAKHNGNAVSMMNNKLRINNPINTMNYDE
jgi:glycosyltransferase involved in cell wall biosynthesis